MKPRCPWANRSPLETSYHDSEWGTPLHDDRLLFEFLVLEGAQAGLSWVTILRKREAYRAAFDHFDPGRLAGYDQRKVNDLLSNPGIVRNRLKVKAAVNNARRYQEVTAEFGSFDRFIWSFVDGRTLHNAWRSVSEIPTSTEASERMSRELRRRGFRFVGPTICYAYMQAVGMVNDHTVDCFRWQELIDGTEAN